MCYSARSLTASVSTGVTIVEGHIDLCLCLSVLPGFLGSNLVAQNVVNHLGHDGALSYFTGLVSRPPLSRNVFMFSDPSFPPDPKPEEQTAMPLSLERHPLL
jgi:hypothetical protein